jgi:hypothetical protein
MLKNILFNKALVFLLQEMTMLNGLTHNLTVCFESWLFVSIILGLLLCCIVSIIQKTLPVNKYMNAI